MNIDISVVSLPGVHYTSTFVMKIAVLTLVFAFTMFSASTTRALISRIPGKQLLSLNHSLTRPNATTGSHAARQWMMMMMMTSDTSTSETSVVSICQEKIQKALEAESVKVTGAFDDPNGSHISIQVVSSLFEGKRPMQRQQLVYKAIWEELQGPVHAVDSMTCKTPSEQ